ncbi:MAG: FAD:protein FMN transferase [Burkholderiales bacterium]|nr:FAD:protein FMN transferase [Burkholderiales bacterium]
MKLFRQTFRAMAAENEIQLAAADIDVARRAARSAIADVRRIEAKYSRYRDDSVTTRVNCAAGGDAVPIDTETAALLRYADQCHALSGGLFDITSGVLRRAWDFRREPPALPQPGDLAEAVALVGWAEVEWSAKCIRLPRAGMEVDFGGIGKEYAADRVATICLEHGLRHGLVNLGGDVRAIGPQADGTPWRVGIRHPRHTGAALAGFDLAAGALATSGDYERYFEIDGRRYCHILNPGTGMPVAHWQSISVVSPLCVVAGSCATIAMLLEDGAEAFLDAQDVQWLGVAADGGLRRASYSGASDPL